MLDKIVESAHSATESSYYPFATMAFGIFAGVALRNHTSAALNHRFGYGKRIPKVTISKRVVKRMVEDKETLVLVQEGLPKLEIKLANSGE